MRNRGLLDRDEPRFREVLDNRHATLGSFEAAPSGMSTIVSGVSTFSAAGHARYSRMTPRAALGALPESCEAQPSAERTSSTSTAIGAATCVVVRTRYFTQPAAGLGPAGAHNPPMPTKFIRPATRDDLPLILSLIRDLAEYERDPGAVVATESLLEANLFGRGDQPAVATCVIGELDGVPQGFALYFFNFSTWLGRSGLYLEDLFVRPPARGAGLGKALLLHLAKIAVERGCGRMEWSVLDWNQSAIGFYKSLGAKPMDEWTVFRLTGDALTHAARTK